VKIDPPNEEMFMKAFVRDFRLIPSVNLYFGIRLRPWQRCVEEPPPTWMWKRQRSKKRA